MSKKFPVLVEQRLVAGVKVRRRDSVFVGPADSGRQRVGEVLVRAHHVVACKIERLSRQVRQRLVRIDLRAPLAQDLLEIASCIVVRVERVRLFFRECGRLSHCGRHEAEIADGNRGERRDGDDIGWKPGAQTGAVRGKELARAQRGWLFVPMTIPVPRFHRIRLTGMLITARVPAGPSRSKVLDLDAGAHHGVLVVLDQDFRHQRTRKCRSRTAPRRRRRRS